LPILDLLYVRRRIAGTDTKFLYLSIFIVRDVWNAESIGKFIFAIGIWNISSCIENETAVILL